MKRGAFQQRGRLRGCGHPRFLRCLATWQAHRECFISSPSLIRLTSILMPDVFIKSRTLVAFVLGVCVFVADVPGATALDLSRATVVIPSTLSNPEKKAVTMLIEEVQKRTQIHWETKSAWPNQDIPVIAVG